MPKLFVILYLDVIVVPLLGWHHTFHFNSNSVMYVNNIEPEMFLPPGSESFNHNATRTTSSRSRSNNVNNNIVPVY